MTQKKIRIVDIARMAGVSAGTVDRVLHNRGRIAQDKKERIEKIINEINYRPNMAARLLASKHNYAIAVIAPSYVGESYWKQVSEGIEKAAEELNQYNLKVDFIRFDQYDRNSFSQAVDTTDWEIYNGVIIATLFENHVKKLSAELNSIKKPYVYIDSSIEEQNDLAYFGVDAHASGYIAGKLLMRELGENPDIVIVHIKFSRNEISVQMRKREEGLMQYIKDSESKCRIHYLELDPTNTSESITRLEDLFSNIGNTAGVLVLNSRVYEFTGLLGDVRADTRNKMVIAGFEAIAPNVAAMKNGDIKFLISQRPELQGYDAVKALGNLFIYGTKPEKTNHMPIDILIPENIDYYNNYKL